MIAVYDGPGIEFVYPENWELQNSETAEWPHEVSIHSPDGAFWSATLYPDHMNDKQLIQQALDAMQSEYDELEFEELTRTIGDQDLSGYELRFYCLDFLITCHMLIASVHNRSVLLVYQSDDRDFDKLEPVFTAVTLSLLRRKEHMMSD